MKISKYKFRDIDKKWILIDKSKVFLLDSVISFTNSSPL